MGINIKKLRKYYLYTKYKEFFLQNDIVIFYNNFECNIDKLSLLIFKDRVNLISCKNTILKKVLAFDNKFFNLIQTQINLIGLRCFNVSSSYNDIKDLLDFLKKIKLMNSSIGILYKKKKKFFFLLPINLEIIYYYYNVQYFFKDFIRKCIIPQYYYIFYNVLLLLFYNYISFKYIYILFYYKINQIKYLQTIKASIAQ